MSPQALVRRLGRAVQPLAPRTNEGLVVLAYHLIGAGTSSPVDIDTGIFRAQMEMLAAEEPVVSLRAGIDSLASDVPGRSFVITFDDAYANFADTAFKVLEDLRMPSTLYVPVDFVAGRGRAPIRGTDGLPACSWSTLRDLTATGLVEIGSHTVSHPDLTSVSRETAEHEIRSSGELLRDRLGCEVTSFCYPRGLWTSELEGMVTRHYSTSAVGGGRRVLRRSEPCTQLPRFPIRRDTAPRLEAIRTHQVWTEEALADRLRRWRR